MALFFLFCQPEKRHHFLEHDRNLHSSTILPICCQSAQKSPLLPQRPQNLPTCPSTGGQPWLVRPRASAIRHATPASAGTRYASVPLLPQAAPSSCSREFQSPATYVLPAEIQPFPLA